ncbi:MAG: hypothetical protein K2O06_11790 [Acetatifactor sp.]|nr:hypothetical protein [Acetatifactor sp.]
MAKRILMLLTLGLLAAGMAGCSAPDYADTSSIPQGFEPKLSVEQTVMCSVRITAGETVLEGVLYDNPTAREFAEMLPLTVELWHPAPGFARAFDLPERIAQKGTPGYEYELGSLAYWDAGPSVALIYKASRQETVVPVVPIGKITSDVGIFAEYGEDITVELAEDGEALPDSGSGTGESAEMPDDGERWGAPGDGQAAEPPGNSRRW